MKKTLSVIASAILLAGVVIFSPSVSALGQNIHGGVNQAGREANQLLDTPPTSTTTKCAPEDIYDVLVTHSVLDGGSEHVRTHKVVGSFESCSYDYDKDRAAAVKFLKDNNINTDGFIQDKES